MSPRVRATLLAAARGGVLCAGGGLLASWLIPDLPLGSDRLLLMAAFGAVAGGSRAAFFGRSVIGTLCVWTSLALLVLDLPAMWPHEYGAVVNPMYSGPLQFYAWLFAAAAVLGLLELGGEAGAALPSVAARGALVGGGLGLLLAVVRLLASLTSPSDYNLLGHGDFDQGLRIAVSLFANTYAWSFALLGAVSVAIAVYARSGTVWVDAGRAIMVVAVLWIVVPFVLDPPWFPSAYGASLQHVIPTSHVPLWGLAMGTLFVVAWAVLHGRGRRPLPAVDRPRAWSSRFPFLLMTLLGISSLAYQTWAVGAFPVARLRQGLAVVRPGSENMDRFWARHLILSPDGGALWVANRLTFSPDGATLWVGNRDGVIWGWKVGPLKDPAWRPRADVVPDRLEKTIISPPPNRRASLHPLPGSSDHAWLEVANSKTAKLIVRHLLKVPISTMNAVTLQGSLAEVWTPAGALWIYWPTGRVLAQTASGATYSPDERFLLTLTEGEGSMWRCFEIASGRQMFTIGSPIASCRFDETSKRIVTTDVEGKQRVFDLSTGEEIPSTTAWHLEAMSPGGAMIARFDSDQGGLDLYDGHTGEVLARFWAGCAVSADGRVSGDLRRLAVCDNERVIWVTPDYPLIDPSFYPPVR